MLHKFVRRFVLEALQSLRSDLERLGSSLLFSTGAPCIVAFFAVLPWFEILLQPCILRLYMQSLAGESAAVIVSHVGLLARVCDVVDLHYHPMLDPLEQQLEDAVLEAASQAATASGASLDGIAQHTPVSEPF